MSLTAEQVRNVARLARLGLADDEIADHAHDLSRIVDFFSILEASDTAEVKAMAHPLNLSARLRTDEAVAVADRDAFAAIAPAATDGVYRVPKVIE